MAEDKWEFFIEIIRWIEILGYVEELIKDSAIEYKERFLM